MKKTLILIEKLTKFFLSKKILLINIQLFIFSILFSFFILEIFFRIFFDQSSSNKFTRYNDYGEKLAGKAYVKVCDHGYCANTGKFRSIRYFIDSNDKRYDVYDVEYNINLDGFRQHMQKKNTKSTISFFGGSHMFGEGLDNIGTLPAQVSKLAPEFNVKNYAFHGHGVHNAVKLLEDKKILNSNYNILLTGKYHAKRSDCSKSYTGSHPSYKLIAETNENYDLVYRGICANYASLSWNTIIQNKIDKHSFLKKSVLINNFRNYLNSSFSSHQINLYQALIKKFVELSHDQGSKPLILYIGRTDGKKRDFRLLMTGTTTDQMPSFFEQNKIDYIDVTVPAKEPFILHKLDRHPSKYTNCLRATAIVKKILNKDADTYCN